MLFSNPNTYMIGLNYNVLIKRENTTLESMWRSLLKVMLFVSVKYPETTYIFRTAANNHICG